MGDNIEDPDEETTATVPAFAEDPIDPIEGTSSNVSNASPVDECSNDSKPSKSTSSPGEVADCSTCQQTAVLKTFTQRKSINGGKSEDIFRNFCENCNQFFGMCCKKVRGTFSFTTEEGRILTNAEKMEYLRCQKLNKSISRNNSTTEIEVEPSPSETSSNGLSEEKEEDLSLGKTLEKEKQQRKKCALSKRKKTNWSTAKRKSKKKTASAKSDGAPAASTLARKPSSAPPKKKETERQTKLSSSGSPQKQRSTRVVGKGTSKSISADFKKETPQVIEKEAIELTEKEVQTDSDLLLRSVCLEETFNKTLEDNFSEQVSLRLKAQPTILKKKFIMMIRTIKEQEDVITKLKAMEDKYQEAARKLKEFGRNTRLTYSDSFLCIRADIVERKEEFKAHQAEVISIMKKQKTKYESYKQEMMKKYNDFQLEKVNLEAKIAFLEQERNYEKDRAAFFMRSNDVYEKERNEAQETATTAVKNLNDRLYVAKNEFCAHCQVTNKLRKKMTAEVAEMTAKTEKAMSDRDSSDEKAKLFESAAQKLGRDCDAIKYERDSWKAYAERFKKENNKLAQQVRVLTEKEKEMTERVAEAMATPKSTSTPKSVACTPNETDRISPPEDGEIVDTPPQNSPIIAPSNSITKPIVKPLVQKIAEKKAASVPIASGFASWIPKEKLNEPAPEIPKALSAFGAPIKTPQQREAEKSRIAPSLQPTPWEKAAQSGASTSDSLMEALTKVQAESFFGGASSGSTPSYSSKSYTEEMNRAMNARKRISDAGAEQTKKPIPAASPAPPQKKAKPAPEPAQSNYKTIAPATPSTSTSSNSTMSSLGGMKKIPKLSDKPPQAEFAAALGVKSDNDTEGIPGFGMIDEAIQETSDGPKKIKPVETKQKLAVTKSSEHNQHPHYNKNNSKKKNSPPNKKQKNRQENHQVPPWHRQDSSPWSQLPQNQYGIQSSSRGRGPFHSDFDRPWSESPNQNREQFGSLPWHRSQDTPFGKVPIQDTFSMGPPPMSRGGPPMGMGMPMRGMPPHQRPPPMGFYSNNDPRDNGPGPGYYPPSQYSPPNSSGRGNPRSFYS